MLSDAAVEAHYAAVAREVDFPILIYNFPAVSGRNLPPALIARLAEGHPNIVGIPDGLGGLGRTLPPALIPRLAEAHPNIVGIKETLDSIGHIAQVLALVRPKRPDFSVLCGFEHHLLNTLVMGGDGSIPGMANVAPETSVAGSEGWRGGDLAQAADLVRQRLDFPSLYELGAPFFVVVKEAMALAGSIEHPTVRLPAVPLGEDARTQPYAT